MLIACGGGDGRDKPAAKVAEPEPAKIPPTVAEVIAEKPVEKTGKVEIKDGKPEPEVKPIEGFWPKVARAQREFIADPRPLVVKRVESLQRKIDALSVALGKVSASPKKLNPNNLNLGQRGTFEGMSFRFVRGDDLGYAVFITASGEAFACKESDPFDYVSGRRYALEGEYEVFGTVRTARGVTFPAIRPYKATDEKANREALVEYKAALESFEGLMVQAKSDCDAEFSKTLKTAIFNARAEAVRLHPVNPDDSTSKRIAATMAQDAAEKRLVKLAEDEVTATYQIRK